MPILFSIPIPMPIPTKIFDFDANFDSDYNSCHLKLPYLFEYKSHPLTLTQKKVQNFLLALFERLNN